MPLFMLKSQCYLAICVFAVSMLLQPFLIADSVPINLTLTALKALRPGCVSMVWREI